MSACPPRTYEAVNRPMFKRVIAEVAKTHPEINPDTVPDMGHTSGQGYVFAWDYVEAEQKLVAQCLDSPWFAPCAGIGMAMDEMITNARGA